MAARATNCRVLVNKLDVCAQKMWCWTTKWLLRIDDFSFFYFQMAVNRFGKVSKE